MKRQKRIAETRQWIAERELAREKELTEARGRPMNKGTGEFIISQMGRLLEHACESRAGGDAAHEEMQAQSSTEQVEA
eukprot:14241101-Alexandrium_andersonii.AAC.1